METSDLPPRNGDAPLHELGRDELSVLLYAAFTGEELAELMRALGVQVPGFRVESLGDAEKADVIADEIRAHPTAREPVIALLGKVYEFPALDGVTLPAVVAREIGALAVEGDATIRMLWRLLADPSSEVRAQTKEPLAALVESYYGAARAGEEAAGAQEGARPSGPSGGGSRNASAALASEARRARAEAERTKAKLPELKAQLKSARGELAEAQKQAAAHRKAHDRMAEKLQRAELSAKEAKARPARAELDRALKEAADLAARASALEDRERRATEERDALRAEVEKARKALEETQAQRPAAAPPPSEGEALQEVPPTWFLPRFSKEFYDSLAGWDPRIQRAAFKQAYLLAENHRHPSLRAIPLEGLPGYYRVRIATDVRLIYRRVGDKEFEILSLIDREDLDRYVRQAKTR